MERQALEGQSSNWASEASKAKQEYAKLLGHQNNKQKIRRISQISEENFTLKQVFTVNTYRYILVNVGTYRYVYVLIGTGRC